MKFTAFAQTLAMSEAVPTAHPLGGATAHMHACQYDAGKRILLTGEGIRREAKSLYGAFMQAQAMHGIQRAWLINEDGTRKLLFTR